MQTNPLKKTLYKGGVVLGTMLTECASPNIPQMLKTAGYDFFVIDMEHSSFTTETVSILTRCARGAGIICLVRVPSVESFYVSRILDIGADGLVIPRVETRKDVETLVANAKYAPRGRRGLSTRAGHSNFEKLDKEEFVISRNEYTFLTVQIETENGLKNREEILSVYGIDAVLMGLTDLSLSLGIPGQANHPKITTAMEDVIESCKKHNVGPGVHLRNINSVKEWIRRGMRFILFKTDVDLIVDTSAKEIEEIRKD